jgi:acyl-CoA thioester hydrolase
MQVHPAAVPADLPPLSSYPYRSTVPARFGDLAPGGAIEHIGMARNYEDVRGAVMDQVTADAGIERGQLHSFIVRAINEQWAPVVYPGAITFGSAVIAVGGSSFTIEMAAFQEGACVGRSRALAVAVGPDHAPAPLAEPVRTALRAGFLAQPGFRAPPKPAAERRQRAHYAHQLSLATRFSDTDLLGHLNNVSLLRYCDEGRAAVLLTGEGGTVAASPGVVVRADISYLQEARLPMPVTVASRVRSVDGRTLLLEQALFQDAVCVVVCDSTVHVPQELAQRLRGQLPAA